MYRIEITRFKQDYNHTLGYLRVYDECSAMVFECCTVERGWRNNESNVSCVPADKFRLVWEYSNAFKEMLWELKGVDGRSECKIHVANHWHQLRGCIAVGSSHTFIDSDAELDVADSRATLDALHEVLERMNELEINIVERLCQ